MRGWLDAKPDPQFAEKCHDICQTYRPAPERAAAGIPTFSIDEMTGILTTSGITNFCSAVLDAFLFRLRQVYSNTREYMRISRFLAAYLMKNLPHRPDNFDEIDAGRFMLVTSAIVEAEIESAPDRIRGLFAQRLPESRYQRW